MRRKPPRSSELRRPSGKPADGRAIIGTNIRRLRGERGWSQEALAERAGIHRTYLSSVERAERNIAIDNICRIAWALGVAGAELLTEAQRPHR
jgi:transcriptional regulator with XRE-family HTH domain